MDIFSDGPVSTRILNLRAVGNYITKGYKPVTYNPIADIPIDDKLIVCLAIKETRRVYTQSNCFVVNFTSIENPTFRKWVKAIIGETQLITWNQNVNLHLNIKPL